MSIRILLVDDELAIRFSMAVYFGKLGCAVDSAEDVRGAAALLAANNYDAVITDLRLAHGVEADGLSVIRAARDRSLSTRIALFTAYMSPEVETEARALGANALLRKPMSLPDVAQIVYGLLETSGSSAIKRENV